MKNKTYFSYAIGILLISLVVIYRKKIFGKKQTNESYSNVVGYQSTIDMDYADGTQMDSESMQKEFINRLVFVIVNRKSEFIQALQNNGVLVKPNSTEKDLLNDYLESSTRGNLPLIKSVAQIVNSL